MRTPLLLAATSIAALCAALVVPATAQRRDARADTAQADKVYALLKENCWSCHGEPGKPVRGQNGGLNYILDYDKLTDGLVNLRSPEDSTLYTEIAEGSMPRNVDAAGRMQRGGKKLPQADIDLVLAWIKAGAPRWRDPNAPAEGGPVWAEIKTDSPGGRKDFMFSEGPRGSVVMFGGYVVQQSKSVFSGETWVFSSDKWTRHEPRNSPSPAASGAMALDSRRNVAVLFGGLYGDPAHSGQTWEWNGSNWGQARTAANPPARVHHAMAYDPVRKLIVLFGGTDKGVELADTWTWDGKTWTQVSGEGPSARADAAMSWCPQSKAVLLYGGAASAKGLTRETWLFDGTWKKQAPKSNPTATHDCMLATGKDGVVLVGGLGTDGAVDECWTWDGKDWRRLAGGFGARHGAGLASDSKGARFVLFGGQRMNRELSDTWGLTAPK